MIHIKKNHSLNNYSYFRGLENVRVLNVGDWYGLQKNVSGIRGSKLL